MLRSRRFARPAASVRLELVLAALALAGAMVAASAAPSSAQLIQPRPHPGEPPPLFPRPVPPVAGTLRPESIDLDARVNERVARVSVTQTFRNPLGMPLEGDFLFPLPPGVSVSDLTFIADGREMRGEILEAAAARRHYEDVVRRMKDPALLEYAGENAFRARIFPVPPGATRSLTLSYSQVLATDAGLAEFRFPVAGGRLVPGNGGPWSGLDGLRREGAATRLSLDIDIEDSGEIGTVYSPTHAIDVRRDGASRVRVRLSGDGRETPDAGAGWGDFNLYYQLDPGELGLTLLTWDPGDEDGYFLALASPGASLEHHDRAPVSMLFVLDTSGSMAGPKLDEARSALEMALGSLGPRDRFGLVSFSNGVDTFRDRLSAATPDAVREARVYLRDLRATGGTNIAGALDTAMRMLDEASEDQRDGGAPGAADRTRLVFFLTDGLPTVGEQSVEGILKSLGVGGREDRRGHGDRWGGRGGDDRAGAHVFSVGVGYDVNTHLLSRLAEQYGGAVEYVTPDESVEDKVGRLLAKTSRPLLSNIEFGLAGARVRDLYPARIPFLFEGEQVSFVGRFDHARTGNLTAHLSADRPDGGELRATRRFSTDHAAGGDFVARLWASRKVAYLLDEIRLHGEGDGRVEELVSVAKRYGIVTPYTSYLADPAMLASNSREMDEVSMARQAMPALRVQSGADAVGAGRALESMKLSLDAAPLSAPAGPAAHAPGTAPGDARTGTDAVRWVAGRTFYLRGDIWTDAGWPADTGKARVLRLRPFGGGWFKLTEVWRGAADAAALGDRVRIAIGTALVEITPDGAEDLAPADWTAIRAAARPPAGISRPRRDDPRPRRRAPRRSAPRPPEGARRNG